MCHFHVWYGSPKEEAPTIHWEGRGNDKCITQRCWGHEQRVPAYGSAEAAAAAKQRDARLLLYAVSSADVVWWSGEGGDSVGGAAGGHAASSSHLHLQLRHWSLTISCYFFLVFIGFRSTKLLWHVEKQLLVQGQVTIIFVVFVCLFVCLSVCLFVHSFSQPSLIRLRSN